MTETSPASRDRDVAALVPAAADQASAPANRPRTLAGRIRGSFLGSVGSIVFGMEDRIVSLSVTLLLLVGLGIGRGMIGHRRILSTIAETIGIAAAAAIAGLAIARLIS
jgi:hypothetical protein